VVVLAVLKSCVIGLSFLGLYVYIVFPETIQFLTDVVADDFKRIVAAGIPALPQLIFWSM
jgi:hypothetical protein